MMEKRKEIANGLTPFAKLYYSSDGFNTGYKQNVSNTFANIIIL